MNPLTSERVNDIDDVLFVSDQFVDVVIDEIRKERIERVLQRDTKEIQQIDQQWRCREDLFR